MRILKVSGFDYCRSCTLMFAEDQWSRAYQCNQLTAHSFSPFDLILHEQWTVLIARLYWLVLMSFATWHFSIQQALSANVILFHDDMTKSIGFVPWWALFQLNPHNPTFQCWWCNHTMQIRVWSEMAICGTFPISWCTCGTRSMFYICRGGERGPMHCTPLVPLTRISGAGYRAYPGFSMLC